MTKSGVTLSARIFKHIYIYSSFAFHIYIGFAMRWSKKLDRKLCLTNFMSYETEQTKIQCSL